MAAFSITVSLDDFFSLPCFFFLCFDGGDKFAAATDGPGKKKAAPAASPTPVKKRRSAQESTKANCGHCGSGLACGLPAALLVLAVLHVLYIYATWRHAAIAGQDVHASVRLSLPAAGTLKVLQLADVQITSLDQDS